MDFVLPCRPIPMELISGRGHYERVIPAVMSAERAVWIATANLKEVMVEATGRPGRAGAGRRGDFVSMLEVFDQLAAKGVELRILHAKLPSRAFCDQFDRLPQLVQGGLQLRACPRVHFKLVIVDGTRLYLGSANWTGAGLGAKGGGRRNFEIGVFTEDEGVLDEAQALYHSVWSGAECGGCKLREACEAPLDLGPAPPQPA